MDANESSQYAKDLEREFLRAHEEYADAIFRHCLVRVRNRDVAKDIVQETFTRAWLYIAGGKRVTHMRAFLYRVANNLIVDSARRKKSTSLEALMDDDGFEPVDEQTEDPTNRMAAREVLHLLDSLDEIYRTAVTMRFLDGLSPGEIALILNVSENVVSVRIHRGIARLRKLVDQKPPASRPDVSKFKV